MTKACWLILGLLCGPACAADYFKAYSTDGGSVRTDPCGQISGPGAGPRDLGGGVSAEVRVSQEQGRAVSVTLLFRSNDPGLRLAPEGIRLHVFPGGLVFEPSAIRRAVYRPAGESCPQHGEWLHLTFPPQPGKVDQVALVFAGDTVATHSHIRIGPFRFERTDEVTTEGRTPIRPPISTEALYPSARSRDPLAQTSSSLKGVWVIDAKGTEERMKKAGPLNVREPGLVGTMIGFLFLGMLTFDDNALTVGAYRGARTFRYRLVSSRGGKSEYVRDDPKGPDEEEVLTVTFLGQDTIHVRSTNQFAIEYCAWQRGRPLNESEQFEAGKRAIEAFQATMQNVEAAWFPKKSN